MTSDKNEQAVELPVLEVEVTRLVTFVVDTEAIREELDEEDDEDWNPFMAAAEFIDGLAGAPVDNHADIHTVHPPLEREVLAALDFAIARVDANASDESRVKVDFYLRHLEQLREIVAGGPRQPTPPAE